jgi:hypothetical protein
MALDDGPLPEAGKVLISPRSENGPYWVQTELVEIIRQEDGPGQLRVRLLEQFPYEAFLTVIWGDKSGHASPGPVQELNRGTIRPGRLSAGTWGCEPTGARGLTGPGTAAGQSQYSLISELRAELPRLAEAQRKNRSQLDRVESIPWVTIAFFSAIVLVLVAVAVCGHYDSARRIGIMLGLLR